MVDLVALWASMILGLACSACLVVYFEGSRRRKGWRMAAAVLYAGAMVAWGVSA